MPTWKKLTDVNNKRVDVNMDNVAYVVSYDDKHTTIFFAGGNQNEHPQSLVVKGSIQDVQDGKVTVSAMVV